jgi:predicted acyl esterase
MTIASRFFGKALELPPAERHPVRVERDLPVPMPDGAVLLADRYVPPGSKPPLVLVRSPYGRRGPFGLMYGRLLADGTIQAHIDLWPAGHRFPAGHQLRLQVSSGAHPRYARNTGTSEPLATAATLAPAHQHLYHDPSHPSAITLPVTN